MPVIAPPPLVDPDQPLMGGWRIRLPFPTARRVEGGSLVFWHTPRRLTFWIDVYILPPEEDPVAGWTDLTPPEAMDVVLERDGPVVRHCYRIVEDDESQTLLGHVSDGKSDLLVAARYDDPATITDALAVWRSIAPAAT